MAQRRVSGVQTRSTRAEGDFKRAGVEPATLQPSRRAAAVRCAHEKIEVERAGMNEQPVDAKNNHIFVPLAANNVFPDCTTGCIAVYWHGDEDLPGEAATP